MASARVLADTAEEATEADSGSNSVLIEGQRQRSTVALGDVSATGSRLDIETKDLPASISVVSQDVIQLRGARTAVEAITNAVGMTGGISVGSIPSFATRGFTSNDVTVMRDGIRQNTASQSSRPLDSFLFDRIEVLKGPASLLYGEGAIGGAINYVSKLPPKMIARADNLLPGVAVARAEVLTSYDDYYYTRHPERGEKPLPVIRIQFADADKTWFHLDPLTGQVLERSTSTNRIYRWLYNGLHSWDIRWLWEHRPLWDIAMISFMAGGILLSLLGVVISVRRLRY